MTKAKSNMCLKKFGMQKFVSKEKMVECLDD